MKQSKQLSREELQRKYHQNLVFNYSEYPTLDHWDFNYRSNDYSKSLVEWLKKNPEKNIFFYVHIPFCEQLCWFCTCSKFITKSYGLVKEYMPYLHKEIDLLFNLLKETLIPSNKNVFIPNQFFNKLPVFFKLPKPRRKRLHSSHSSPDHKLFVVVHVIIRLNH